MDRNLIHIYYGEGKGKTTAAIGLGIRALGSGFKVCMIQFLKSPGAGEVEVLKSLEPDFKIFNLDKSFDFFWNLGEAEKEELSQKTIEQYNLAKQIAQKGTYDILILDEILGAVENKMISEEQLTDLLTNNNHSVEIILTGRHVGEKVKEIADYVSEIKEVKHPYKRGIGARKGIEY